MAKKNFKYYLFNKPYGVLSQFTKEVATHVTLADYLNVPVDVYPVGRLDKDSEGLLMLTNDNNIKNALLSPANQITKTYLAQVDGDITADAVRSLQAGVTISVKKKPYKTQPAIVQKLGSFVYPERDPPIRKRADIPTSWIEIKIYEGKNRQIRLMCAAVGFPVLRLIRTAISDLKRDIPLGSMIELSTGDLRYL